MKIELKIRAKREDNNQWLIGFYVFSNLHDDCIYTEGSLFEIKPETIGRCLNINDKNSKEYYEGDIVRNTLNPDEPLAYYFQIKWDDRIHGWNAYPIANMTEKEFDENLQAFGGTITWPDANILNNHWHYEIVGNIYDNPELLVGSCR